MKTTFGIAFALMLAGCAQRGAQLRGHFPSPLEYRFANYSKTCDNIPGYMPDHFGYYLTDEQKRGACTWYFWPGGDPLRKDGSPENARGNPRFWRMAERRLWEAAHTLQLPINVNLLRYVTSTPREQRFEKLGVLNDPGCKKATKPDSFGLWLDECDDPYSSGVMGIRLYPNPDFNARTWDPVKYINHDARIEPPYLGGLSCGVCHIALNPINPPADPANPKWENFVPALGNQYLKEGEMFKGGLTDDNFLYWVYETQQPGTSDTSRISTDFINNPNAINSIWYILSQRPKHSEVMNDGTTKDVPHILKDGSDSIGAAGAALRVYVNIGTCPDYRYSLEDTFFGILRPQRPFDIKKAETDCVDWQLTSARMENAANFLDANQPYYLKNAPGGSGFATSDAEKLNLGKRAFAENCARCHSSKIPPGIGPGMEKHSEQSKAQWVKLVMSDGFLEKNFLSDDERYPVYSDDRRVSIGTNIARSVGTNPTSGHIWQNFSSKTFKEQPSPGALKLDNPFDPAQPIDFKIPATGVGHYRTPSLINVWATAPFFHNNSLGVFNRDPSVKGRIDAYTDAMQKLLWPEKRRGKDSIKVTGKDTVLKVRSLEVRIPRGTPVNLLANIDLHKALEAPEILARLRELLGNPVRIALLIKALANEGQFDADLKKLVPELLSFNQAPDFIEDHGHVFGAELPDDQKTALIEYMKTF
ncbi:MAG: hypothetical protein M3Z36_15395 [Acidobacteriota bacterium]|nr:hypothetical protein [Acidobacteriota bacterium]